MMKGSSSTRRLHWRIRPLLTLAMAIPIALAVASSTVVETLRLRSMFHGELEEKGLLLAEVLNKVLADALYFDDVERVRHRSELLRGMPEVESYRIFNSTGRVLVDSEEPLSVGGPIEEASLELVLENRETIALWRETELELLSPIRAEREFLGGIEVTLNTAIIAAAVRNMIVQHVWQGAVLVAVGVLVAYLLAGWLTAPVRQLMRATRRVAEGDLSFSTEGRRQDELGDLAVAFEEMVHRLEQRARAQAEEYTAQLEKANELLHQHALEDSLTGLPNRRKVLERLEIAMADAERRGEKVGVLFLDLDRFKVVNDSLGHVFGDDVLCKVAKRLERTLRKADTVARLGGDEFTVVVPFIKGAEDATLVAQKVLQAMRRPVSVGDRELVLTASIGISLFPDHGIDTGEVLKNADIAMYRAKKLGRNNFQLYAQHMGDLAHTRLDFESELRQAFVKGEFTAYYQPIQDLSTGTILGVEALLRWRHPKRGLLEACEFVPLLEQMNRMNTLDVLVLREGTAQVRKWQACHRSGLRLAVNLSADHFLDTTLVSEFSAVLQESGFDPHLLEIEITETAAMSNVEASLDALHKLKALGASISIDDFGKGYSSLSYLRYFPISKLKIDREFVRNLPHSKDDSVIIEAVVSLAHSLGIRVTAEGVETEEQRRFLEKTGCDEIQGNGFSPPLAPEELERLLRQPKSGSGTA